MSRAIVRAAVTMCLVCLLLTAASAQPIVTMKHALSALSETTLAIRAANRPTPAASTEKGAGAVRRERSAAAVPAGKR